MTEPEPQRPDGNHSAVPAVPGDAETRPASAAAVARALREDHLAEDERRRRLHEWAALYAVERNLEPTRTDA